MARKPSAGDIDGWLKRFRKYQALETAAQRRRDIPVANRHVEKVTEALNALAASGPEGREVLERLMDDPDPSTRGRAARRVLAWDPDRAIPVLVRLLDVECAPPMVSVEAIVIEREAQFALLDHFGLDILDPTELPGRLAAMGIELPEKIARKMRWED
ncbi:hypothetical protein [Oricola thermophila]|uniref:HEAT repeat domain-containing protein n=1 Tax=Oricola thermophila TaxID=2742145 RepID=A0A6N1V9U9_9HYPH|nr:hypothetical protein [Oricola thermophila]QKV17710.1 hypothetical protein HTY61_04115 [Oricola thermophila]